MKYKWSLAVPASIALLVSMQSVEPLFPLCISLVLGLFFVRLIFTSDPGMWPLFAFVTAVIFSISWFHPVSHHEDDNKNKKIILKEKKGARREDHDDFNSLPTITNQNQKNEDGKERKVLKKSQIKKQMKRQRKLNKRLSKLANRNAPVQAEVVNDSQNVDNEDNSDAMLEFDLNLQGASFDDIEDSRVQQLENVQDRDFVEICIEATEHSYIASPEEAETETEADATKKNCTENMKEMESNIPEMENIPQFDETELREVTEISKNCRNQVETETKVPEAGATEIICTENIKEMESNVPEMESTPQFDEVTDISKNCKNKNRNKKKRERRLKKRLANINKPSQDSLGVLQVKDQPKSDEVNIVDKQSVSLVSSEECRIQHTVNENVNSEENITVKYEDVKIHVPRTQQLIKQNEQKDVLNSFHYKKRRRKILPNLPKGEIVHTAENKFTKINLNKQDLIVQDSKKRYLRKEKRKRRGKVMDDDNECLQKIGISKVYKTLVQFECLQMPSRDLYQEFQFYVLSHNEMMLNRYPLPDNLDLNSRWHRSCQGLILRVCNRCNQAFYVDDTNLQYLSVSPCFYHSSKTNGLHYQCCDGDLSSQGCMSYYCHVTSDPILDNALFRETRDKRQVRMDCDLAVYGLDCEMCITTAGLQVTKIGVVNIEGLTVYETFVLPDQPIVDYVTEYSGVTANDLKGVTTTLKDVQEILLKLLNKNTILVGHGLNNDLKMLRIMHNKVVDTSVVFPRPDGRKRKLKELVKEFLHESIQGSSDGHDCIEDARACVALMLWKIGVDLKSRSSYCRDENLNGFLQNQAYPITGYHYTPPDYDSSDPYYFFRQC